MIDLCSDLAHQPDLRQFRSEDGVTEHRSTSRRICGSQITTIVASLCLVQLDAVGLIFFGLLGHSGSPVQTLTPCILANVIDLVAGTVGFGMASSKLSAKRFMPFAGGVNGVAGLLKVIRADAPATAGTVVSESTERATVVGKVQIQVIAPLLRLWLGLAMIVVVFGAQIRDLTAQGGVGARPSAVHGARR